MMSTQWKEVSQGEFYAHVGQLDCHPCIQPPGRFPFTSIFKTKGGIEVGKVVNCLPKGRHPVKTSYFLPQEDK